MHRRTAVAVLITAVVFIAGCGGNAASPLSCLKSSGLSNAGRSHNPNEHFWGAFIKGSKSYYADIGVQWYPDFQTARMHAYPATNYVAHVYGSQASALGYRGGYQNIVHRHDFYVVYGDARYRRVVTAVAWCLSGKPSKSTH